uniref:Uncharacterized protein n=1 Tax=Anguilla anguilla TaxID=7936 RepID=A0A0E9TWQ9_ANGAN
MASCFTGGSGKPVWKRTHSEAMI